MPVSNYTNVGPIMNSIRAIHKEKPINSALDIGFGFGKYGFMLREFLDVRVKRFERHEWKARIDGVEIWESYVGKLQKEIYSYIHIGDILDLYPKFRDYDLIIMSEIIEHLDKDDGLKLLTNISFNTALIITTPQVFVRGGGRGWENPYEEHISLWKEHELRYLFPTLKTLTNTAFLVTKHG